VTAKTPTLDAFALAGGDVLWTNPNAKVSFHYLLLVCKSNVLLVFPAMVDFLKNLPKFARLL